VSDPATRCIENDVSPEREALSPSEVEQIRRCCARAVDAGIPRILAGAPPRAPVRRARFGGGPTLYVGLLGQAFGFLHLYERTGKPEELELARTYLVAASEAFDRSWYPRPEEWLSFHGTGGFSAVAAVIHDRLGDPEASARHLEEYQRLATPASDPDFPSEDLLWGRGGYLFGAAFLRARLGPESMPDRLVAGAHEAMLERGRRTAREHESHLIAGRHGRVPLLYLNLNAFVMTCFARAYVPGRSKLSRALAGLVGSGIVLAGARTYGLRHRYDLGLVHGLPGNLYLLMHFPDLLAGEAARYDVRKALEGVAECVDAEQGVRELLPSPHSSALHARTGSPEYTERVHWCSGSAAAVFLFARAYEVFGDPAYLDVARRAAQHVWSYGLLRKGNGICHGIAGNGYAFLSLYRRTDHPRDLHRALHFARHSWSDRVVREQRTPDRPWSLYEGLMGTLCFYRDCLEPGGARFPAFEV
jgi:hypothetical protein